MNIDFSARPGFSAYVILLMVAGLVMVVLASPTVRRQRPIQRVINAVFGVGFFGYGFFLAFLFKGGSYVIFFQAFIVPILLISRTIRSAAAAPSARPAAPSPYPPAGYPAQPGQYPAQPQGQYPAQPGQYPTPPQGQYPAPQYPGAPQPQYPSSASIPDNPGDWLSNPAPSQQQPSPGQFPPPQ